MAKTAGWRARQHYADSGLVAPGRGHALPVPTDPREWSLLRGDRILRRKVVSWRSVWAWRHVQYSRGSSFRSFRYSTWGRWVSPIHWFSLRFRADPTRANPNSVDHGPGRLSAAEPGASAIQRRQRERIRQSSAIMRLLRLRAKQASRRHASRLPWPLGCLSQGCLWRTIPSGSTIGQ